MPLEVDIYTSLDGEVIQTDVFVEGRDDPVETSKSDWHTVIANEFEAHCIPNTNSLVSSGNLDTGITDLWNIVSAIRDSADHLEKMILECTVFNRDDWVQAGQPEDKKIFVMTYSEYINAQYEKGEL